jgi:hypothetical protein
VLYNANRTIVFHCLWLQDAAAREPGEIPRDILVANMETFLTKSIVGKIRALADLSFDDAACRLLQVRLRACVDDWKTRFDGNLFALSPPEERLPLRLC